MNFEPVSKVVPYFFQNSTAVTHVDLEWGFWCKNSEQPDENCADFQVRYCCPKTQELACDKEGYAWTVWLDRDDPVDSGDWENKDGFDANVVCKTPHAVEVNIKAFFAVCGKKTYYDF